MEAEEASKAAAAETAPAAGTTPLSWQQKRRPCGRARAGGAGMAALARLTPREQDGRLVAMQEQWGVRFTAAQIDAIRAVWSDVRPLQP